MKHPGAVGQEGGGEVGRLLVGQIGGGLELGAGQTAQLTPGCVCAGSVEQRPGQHRGQTIHRRHQAVVLGGIEEEGLRPNHRHQFGDGADGVGREGGGGAQSPGDGVEQRRRSLGRGAPAFEGQNGVAANEVDVVRQRGGLGQDGGLDRGGVEEEAAGFEVLAQGGEGGDDVGGGNGQEDDIGFLAGANQVPVAGVDGALALG